MLYVFLISLLVTLVVYILRGLEIVTDVPGSLILLPAAVAVVSFIVWGIQKTSRF